MTLLQQSERMKSARYKIFRMSAIFAVWIAKHLTRLKTVSASRIRMLKSAFTVSNFTSNMIIICGTISSTLAISATKKSQTAMALKAIS